MLASAPVDLGVYWPATGDGAQHYARIMVPSARFRGAGGRWVRQTGLLPRGLHAMLLRLRLVLGSLVGSAMLLLTLCLGAQNLENRPQLNLGFTRMAPLPSGFLVGLALAIGVASGGSAVALLAGRSPRDGP